MPNLRSLALNHTDKHRLPLWPPEHTAPFPWPKLERLVISPPVVDDGIYENLPQTLRSLSLRYWKHAWYYHIYPCEPGPPERVHLTAKDPDYDTMLHASSLSVILRRCHLPALQSLEVEYVQDEAKDDFLLLLVASFPRLTRRKLQRYQKDDTENVPLRTVCIVMSDIRDPSSDESLGTYRTGAFLSEDASPPQGTS